MTMRLTPLALSVVTVCAWGLVLGVLSGRAELAVVVLPLLLGLLRIGRTVAAREWSLARALSAPRVFEGERVTVTVTVSADGPVPLLLRARIADRDANQKAIELRLGKRVGSLELDRVLGRDDQERRLEPEGLPFHRDLGLLHRLQQRGLGLGRCPVDLVGQQEVREDGARAEFEARLALIEQKAPGDVGGQEIGRALQTLEGQTERLGEEPRDQRLGEARIVLDQDVAARENPGEDALEHVALADDHARERAQDLPASLGDPVELHRRVSSDAMTRASASMDGPRPNLRPGGFSSVSAEPPRARASATSLGHKRCSK